jgi:ABC-type nitrate/sulfonate/bicarbonate transport system substrate-binding protein
MPPEPVEDAPTALELVIVWQPLEDIKNEISNDDPDPTRLQKTIEALVMALKKGYAWCLKKGDLIVDTAIKWAIPAGGTTYFALNPEKLEAVIQTAKKLLGVL